MAIEVRGVCTLLQVIDMPTALRFYRDVLGFEIVGNTPEQFTAFQAQEYARWKKVIEVGKITAD